MTATTPPVPRIGRGILLMCCAMAILPVMDAIAKLLGKTLPSLEIAFARLAVQFVLAAAIALALGRFADFRPPRIHLHVVRGLMLGLATLLFFTAVRVMPLTDAIATFFVEPMILTALSGMILKERIGPRRWAACAVGFVGAMIIVRPSLAVFGAHALLPLGTAFLFACYLILTRKLSGEGSMLAGQLMTGLSGATLLGLVLLTTTALGVEGWSAVRPQGWEWPLLVSMGAISLVGHGLVLAAFARAPATVLAPFNYMEIVTATALGWFVFGDFPDAPTWAGAGLIVASGLYIVHRERVRGQTPTVAEG